MRWWRTCYPPKKKRRTMQLQPRREVRGSFCKGSGRSQSATQLWPQISAGFVVAERRIHKWGRSGRARCHLVRCDVRHCAMECECFGPKTLTMCSVILEPRVMREVSAWSQWQDDCTTTVHEKNVCAVGVLFTHPSIARRLNFWQAKWRHWKN